MTVESGGKPLMRETDKSQGTIIYGHYPRAGLASAMKYLLRDRDKPLFLKTRAIVRRLVKGGSRRDH